MSGFSRNAHVAEVLLPPIEPAGRRRVHHLGLASRISFTRWSTCFCTFGSSTQESGPAARFSVAARGHAAHRAVVAVDRRAAPGPREGHGHALLAGAVARVLAGRGEQLFTRTRRRADGAGRRRGCRQVEAALSLASRTWAAMAAPFLPCTGADLWLLVSVTLASCRLGSLER